MIDKKDVLVIKNRCQIIICFDGKKLVKEITGFEHKTKDEIKDWFIKEMLGGG